LIWLKADPGPVAILTGHMNASSSLEFTPETRIGAIVAAYPVLGRLFEGLQIDYCCGGKQTLAFAAASRGLSVETVVAMLQDATAALAAGPTEVDASAMSLSELADHIEQTHHHYLKEELPRFLEMAERVARKHGWRDPRLAPMAATVQELAGEMMSHMAKEEKILFPLMRKLEKGEQADLTAPILQMEAEHIGAEELTARLRLLTDGFVPDAEACNTHRALLAGLAEFEADLKRHVHKENNVLFPRAMAQAAVNG
jgi:regulator of cell morphogenesis and NO signaling